MNCILLNPSSFLGRTWTGAIPTSLSPSYTVNTCNKLPCLSKSFAYGNNQEKQLKGCPCGGGMLSYNSSHESLIDLRSVQLSISLTCRLNLKTPQNRKLPAGRTSVHNAQRPSVHSRRTFFLGKNVQIHRLAYHEPCFRDDFEYVRHYILKTQLRPLAYINNRFQLAELHTIFKPSGVWVPTIYLANYLASNVQDSSKA